MKKLFAKTRTLVKEDKKGKAHDQTDRRPKRMGGGGGTPDTARRKAKPSPVKHSNAEPPTGGGGRERKPLGAYLTGRQGAWEGGNSW